MNNSIADFFSIYKKNEGLTIATKEDFQHVYDEHFSSYKDRTADDDEMVFRDQEQQEVEKLLRAVEGLQVKRPSIIIQSELNKLGAAPGILCYAAAPLKNKFIFPAPKAYTFNELIKNKYWHLLKHYLNFIEEKKEQGKHKSFDPGGEAFIKPELLPRLKDIEVELQPQIELWRKNAKGTKIKCAAFVELLMDNHYFNAEYKVYNRESCEAFALSRYNCKIKIQMKGKEDKSREAHKPMLSKHFKNVPVRT